MPGFGALTFMAPWALAALAVLPLLWLLLRVRPPAPRRIAFPAVRLLFGLGEDEQTPARTPPWLLILRLVLAALVILAAAHPVIDIPAAGRTGGPLVLVIDDGWAAAAGWERRAALGEALIEGAALEGRGARVAGTAPIAVGADGRPRFALGALTPARDALAALRLARPKPWPVDRAGFAEAFRGAAADMEDAEIAWLSDGIADSDPAGTASFMAALEAAGPVTAWLDPPEDRALALLPPAADAGGLALRAARAAPGAARTIVVHAAAADGRVLASQPLTFAEGEARAEGLLDVPLDLRNAIARLAIEGEASAAAALFLDERYRRRPAGLISGGGFESDQPLLSDLYYLERALAPFSETRRGNVEELIGGGVSLLVLADVGQLTADAENALARWIESGGVLVRFAGARVAEGVDGLVPVRLRGGGGRALGGALTWERPRGLGPFPDASPFAGLAIPDDVAVERQVLAEPALDLDARSWARLDDGTPLVTAERRGAGWLVLFHTTANAEWSSLALSGLFVEMMRRIAGLSEGVAGADAAGVLPPLTSLDGFGRLGDPPSGAAPIAARDFAAARPGPAHPPGEYGDSMQRRALNLGGGELATAALAALPGDAVARGYAAARARDLRPWLLAAALALAVADTLIALRLRGRLRAPFRRRAGALAAPLALVVPLVLSGDAAAQALSDAEAAALTQQTRFAWVETGDAEIDRVSAEGLTGLSWVLRARTAVEAGAPVGVDPARDELAFFPLLYWPASAGQAPLDAAAIGRIDDYLRRGGLILFDTRDRSPGADGETPGGARLRALLRGLDIPPLRRVPGDHALTRAFYLLDRFPGRWTGGGIWVESHEGGANDGVSSVVVGSNDYAAAWALDADGFPLYPTIPGTDRQREWAMRFGINLAMYALTGNYKADQVHIPAILRRLGETGAAE